MEYDLWFPSDSVEILCEAVKYQIFTHYKKIYFTFNWNVLEILLTYETKMNSNAEQEVHLYYVTVFPFTASLWMDGKRKHVEVCSFKSMVVVKYLRHFFDFIYKSASWTSVVLSLTWKL